MAKTIDEGFNEFHKRLVPTSRESEAAKNHRASIEACLISNFGMKGFFRTGSFGNGTSIRVHSDVDYFAHIPTDNLTQNSSTTLQKVRDVLDARFPNTGVYVDAPAIVVPFGTNNSESTEIIPADFIKDDENGNAIYDIANGSGGWMRSSPGTHNRYVKEIDEKLDSMVKPLVRFVKAWKYYRNVPIRSFYLEMRVAKYASEESSIVYSIDVKNILKLLRNNLLAALQDPTGISGYIAPCSSDAKKSDALSKLETALKRAEKAREAESQGEISDAFYWWNLVFNEKFPAYG